jgi:putative serine/threonine protein kinase
MLSQQNVSFLDEELDIRSSRLIPLISYPHFSEREYKDRIIEMESLGITSIILGGKTIVNGAHIAGKGCVGIVVKAKAGSRVCALKIRRTDADRMAMDNEARFHKIANNEGVGPSLEGHTKNLIAMEFVTGQSIIDWVIGNNATKSKICTIAAAILDQCFSLDVAGLDHGELSRLARHVIVSDRPYIIDFESASTTRKTCNVTAAAQSILLYGIVANKVKKILGNTDREKVIHALRTYKHLHTRANFDAVLDSLFT